MREERQTKYGNQDTRETGRKLSPAEERRLSAFEELSESLCAQGYRRVELTVSIVKANLFAVALFIPLLIVGGGLYLLKNPQFGTGFGRTNPLVYLVVFAVMIVVHELIHGLSWAVFTEHHGKDIEFGFMKEYLTPYCTCRVPLKKGQYIFGALMPLVLVGLVPLAAGILTGSFTLLLIGVIMTDGAAGDIMIVWNILRYRSGARDVLYVDHPTQGGGVIFEKQ